MRNDPLRELDGLHILLQGDLTSYERTFLKSVRKVTEWSDKQRAEYFRIKNKYLKPHRETD
jgi:hypothetical protein